MLLICKTCGGNVSSSAENCPHCGETNYRRQVSCDLCNGLGEYTDKVYIDGKESSIYETLTIRCPGCWGKGSMTEGFSNLNSKPGGKYYELTKQQYFIRAEKKGNKGLAKLRECPRCKGYGNVTTDVSRRSSRPVNGNNHHREDYTTTKSIKMHCPDCMESGLALQPEPKKGCFITTATCIAKNKADNCYELEILRKFRDNFLDKNYPNEIDEYYKTSPEIVRLINNNNRKEEIYSDIEKELNDCIFFIENKKYELAFQTYRKMFVKLKKDFLL